MPLPALEPDQSAVKSFHDGFVRYTSGKSAVGLSPLYVSFISAVAILLLLSKHHLFIGHDVISEIESMTAKSSLGFYRLLNTTVIYILLAQVYQKLKVGILANAMARLGRH